jgi:hypothetical protein
VQLDRFTGSSQGWREAIQQKLKSEEPQEELVSRAMEAE